MDGSLCCLGSNEHGEFGNGTYINSNDPIQVVFSNGLCGIRWITYPLCQNGWLALGDGFNQLGSLEPELFKSARPVSTPDSVSTQTQAGLGIF